MSDFAIPVSRGGQKTAIVAAGTTGADSVISAKPGRINKIVATAAGTALLVLYDHPTATSGAQIVWKSAATMVLGDNIDLDIPVANGITALKANGSAAVTVYYTEDGPTQSSNAGQSLGHSLGGQFTAYHAAGSTGAAASYGNACRLCRVVVLAQGSVATAIYDAASAIGTKLFVVPASGTTTVAAGTVYEIQAPIVTGIYVGGATNTSELLVTYATNTPFGR